MRYLNKWVSCIFVLFIVIVISGCAGISVFEFQDAETLGQGNSSLGMGTSTGFSPAELYKDSTRSIQSGSASWTAIEINYQRGIQDNMDLGVSLWNSSFFSYFNFINLKASYGDIGLKLNWKYRLTPPDWKRNISVGLTVLGQVAHYNQETEGWKSSIAAIAPEVIYSRNFYEPVPPGEIHNQLFNFLRSGYVGFKAYFIVADVDYSYSDRDHDINITKRPILFVPFIGVKLGEYPQQYIEFEAPFMKNPYTGQVEGTLYFGCGSKFVF